ncbi:MAG: glycine--tRNA ligase subunit beta [Alphaproteobacteria bacterium]|nr:glycine--tRNA ligase subunit beta [Alphaproteobacteria bacterium SS10]
MADFLLELFSEEIPARMQADAAKQLGKLLGEQFKAAGIKHGEPTLYYGPRRLTAIIPDLLVATEAVKEERRGPRADAPEQAINGFLRGNGLDSLDQCEKRETPKGEFWFVVLETPAQQTAELLPGIIAQVVGAMPWPKSMRWARSTARWVRPLQSILALFDGKPVPGRVELGNGQELSFGTVTQGHRFLAPGEIEIADPAHYLDQLRAAKVMADPAERREAIESALAEAAKAKGLTVKADPGLVTEVMGLVEWPMPLVGQIDNDFMGLPPEVLITSMRSHQKYFALEAADGSMAANFGVVSNMTASDGGAKIVAGNERVLRARLSDAKFFWDQDRKTALEDYVPQLRAITFHEKLGTVAERVNRLQGLSFDIAGLLEGAEPNDALRAAKLAKADLVTGMVGEFPELQGLMGRYYAAAAGEPQAISDAIADHYKPAGQSDAVPTAPVSIAVALAEKLDTLVGFFAIDEKPTGSRDPFALRRAALGIIRIILENDLRLSLNQLLTFSKENYLGVRVLQFMREASGETAYREVLEEYSKTASKVDIEELADELKDAQREKFRVRAMAFQEAVQKAVEELPAFFADRLKVALRERGIRHDLIDAVFAKDGGDDLVGLVARVEALQELLGSDAGANLLAAYRRGANIVRKEREKGGVNGLGAPNEALLAEDAEKGLFTALAKVDGEVSKRLGDEDYAGAMRAFAELRQPVDRFFEEVMVNVDDADLRTNRLAMLEKFSSAYDQIADFSKIEG